MFSLMQSVKLMCKRVSETVIKHALKVYSVHKIPVELCVLSVYTYTALRAGN